jgi:hypothetical protein
VAGSPRSDDDKAGTPLAGLSCSCWVLHKPIEKSSAWGQKTPYYNRPTQDGLRGHFVLRAIGKRFRKDRTAGCEKVVGIRFALDSSLEGGVRCELVSKVSFIRRSDEFLESIKKGDRNVEPVSEAKFPASWENTGNFAL